MTRTKDWLKYSEELADIADLLLNNGKFSWSCFTSQQAALAALKAILSSLNESTFGDNLIAHLRTIKNKKEIPEDIKKACHKLNDYFTTSRDLERKEDSTPTSYFTFEEAKATKELAMKIIRFAYSTSN